MTDDFTEISKQIRKWQMRAAADPSGELPICGVVKSSLCPEGLINTEALMTIVLNHTIVPARDKVAAARFFARIFGLNFDGSSDHFAPVRVNETLTLLFDEDPSRAPSQRALPQKRASS